MCHILASQPHDHHALVRSISDIDISLGMNLGYIPNLLIGESPSSRNMRAGSYSTLPANENASLATLGSTYLGIGSGSLKAGGGTEGLLGRGEGGGGANEERGDSELHLGGGTTNNRLIE